MAKRVKSQVELPDEVRQAVVMLQVAVMNRMVAMTERDNWTRDDVRMFSELRHAIDSYWLKQLFEVEFEDTDEV